jgi:hypothetical protein
MTTKRRRIWCPVCGQTCTVIPRDATAETTLRRHIAGSHKEDDLVFVLTLIGIGAVRP